MRALAGGTLPAVSRGPGRWQRALLESLDDYDLVPVMSVLGWDASRSDQEAVRRAARRLAIDGKARVVYLWQCNTCEELFDRWFCPTHRGGRRVLVVTRLPNVRSLGDANTVVDLMASPALADIIAGRPADPTVRAIVSRRTDLEPTAEAISLAKERVAVARAAFRGVA